MGPMDALETGKKLVHLLTQQKTYYQQLQQLSHQQRALVDGSDPEGLLRLLGGRQRLINRLTVIDKELQPLRQRWQEIAESMDAHDRERALALVRQVQEILQDILKHDQADSKSLEQKKDEVASEIKKASQGKRMNQAYQAYRESQSRFYDSQLQKQS